MNIIEILLRNEHSDTRLIDKDDIYIDYRGDLVRIESIHEDEDGDLIITCGEHITLAHD